MRAKRASRRRLAPATGIVLRRQLSMREGSSPCSDSNSLRKYDRSEEKSENEYVGAQSDGGVNPRALDRLSRVYIPVDAVGP